MPPPQPPSPHLAHHPISTSPVPAKPFYLRFFFLLTSKACRGQKLLKPLIEIAILSEEISARHHCTNKVVIRLGQVRCLFESGSPAYDEAIFLLLRHLGDEIASYGGELLPLHTAGNSHKKKHCAVWEESTRNYQSLQRVIFCMFGPWDIIGKCPRGSFLCLFFFW